MRGYNMASRSEAAAAAAAAVACRLELGLEVLGPHFTCLEVSTK
jgi:hypothetical protein